MRYLVRAITIIISITVREIVVIAMMIVMASTR